ncbi:MAG: polysaccharide deacetylase family protein [Lachnospiraceae bacterium]|nr:polysaccharide deacetylase family protein [Lachnospiraceae bacterium]
MDSQEIEKQRAKRKRVKRMKTFIVTFITTWILVSILAIAFLSFKVFSLQRQLNDLSSKIENQQMNASTYNDGDSDSAVLASYSASAEDNLAEAGDTLKVYLTFDDGPSDNSNEILDILDDYNVKATFFVVGREDENSLAVYKRIVEEGHTIGMHSYSHSYATLYSSLDSFQSDLERIQNLIYDATGVDCDLYRFPGGSSNQVSNADMTDYIRYLNDEDIRYLDWNVASGDATSVAYSADDLVENVMADVVKYKTSVVLMHDADNKDATVEALPKLIEQLQGIGAVILPVSEDTEMIQHVTIANENE